MDQAMQEWFCLSVIHISFTSSWDVDIVQTQTDKRNVWDVWDKKDDEPIYFLGITEM